MPPTAPPTEATAHRRAFRAICAGARARGWQVQRLPLPQMAEISDGARRALIFRSTTDRSGAASVHLCNKPAQQRALLALLGFELAKAAPTPDTCHHMLVLGRRRVFGPQASAALALELAEALCLDPVAVDIHQGKVVELHASPDPSAWGPAALDAYLDALFLPKTPSCTRPIQRSLSQPWRKTDGHGAYLQSIVAHARQRGLDAWALPDSTSDWALLSDRRRIEPVRATLSDRTGYPTMWLARAKSVSQIVLQQRGYPVPEARLVKTAAHARDLLRRHDRLVTKPLDGSHGVGLSLDIQEMKALTAGIARAKQANLLPLDLAVVQQQVVGDDLRVLVIDQRQLYATRREPAQVVGDGLGDVQALIDAHNAAARFPSRCVRCGPDLDALLASQGLGLASVPSEGQAVALARVANAAQGGRCVDVSEQIGPAPRALALAIAKDLDMGMVGVDFVIGSLANDPGLIIEINHAPALNIHERPDQGTDRTEVAAQFVAMLFPWSGR